VQENKKELDSYKTQVESLTNKNEHMQCKLKKLKKKTQQIKAEANTATYGLTTTTSSNSRTTTKSSLVCPDPCRSVRQPRAKCGNHNSHISFL
jgi:regulator of replication initiation timing